MRWSDRLAAALATNSPDAKSAESAKSPAKPPIGTIGAFGIGTLGVREAASDAPSPPDPPSADELEALAMEIGSHPAVRVTGPAGWEYCRSEARRRLTLGQVLAQALTQARQKPE